MPLRRPIIDDGDDLPTNPADRESEISDRRAIENIRGRATNIMKGALAQPELLDVSMIIRRLRREGNIVYENVVNGKASFPSLAQFLEQTSPEFQTQIYEAICYAIKKHIHYEGLTLDEKMDILRNMCKIKVGINNGKISSVFVFTEEEPEPANDVTLTENDCKDDRLRASGKVSKIIPKALN